MAHLTASFRGVQSKVLALKTNMTNQHSHNHNTGELIGEPNSSGMWRLDVHIPYEDDTFVDVQLPYRSEFGAVPMRSLRIHPAEGGLLFTDYSSFTISGQDRLSQDDIHELPVAAIGISPGESIVLGRSNSLDLPILERPVVSRKHFRVELTPDGHRLHIVDNQSFNGTAGRIGRHAASLGLLHPSTKISPGIER